LEDPFSLKLLPRLAGIFGSRGTLSFFYYLAPSTRAWSFSFKRDLFLLSYRMKDDLKSPLITWLDSLEFFGLCPGLSPFVILLSLVHMFSLLIKFTVGASPTVFSSKKNPLTGFFFSEELAEVLPFSLEEIELSR
jgi:hypothetical protein